MIETLGESSEDMSKIYTHCCCGCGKLLKHPTKGGFHEWIYRRECAVDEYSHYIAKDKLPIKKVGEW